MWNFHPVGGCQVTKCMYHTSKLSEGCLLRGRKESDEGGLSDEEIAYYKGLGSDAYAEAKEQAMFRIRRLVSLYKYLEWLRSSQRVPPLLGEELVAELMKRRPFKLKTLGIKRAELGWLFNEALYVKFIQDFNHEYRTSQADMLHMTRREFRAMVRKTQQTDKGE